MPIRFFTEYPKARGLLFMHETGQGKSISAIAAAETFRTAGRRTIVVVAKTLQNNFKDNIAKYKRAMNATDDATILAEITRDYAFVSANANNMLTQLKRVSQPTELQDVLDADDDEDSGVVADAKSSAVSIASVSLEGAFVIVDEAHHLFNGIVNGSRNARGLYDVIMHTKDIRLLFLTSSVITNTPFELVPCFNMIAGYELLPVLYPDFIDMFVNKATGGVRNMDHFKSRIYGLTSYYGSWFETGGELNIHSTVRRPHMPTRLPIREVMVPMSRGQYGAYAAAREKERKAKAYVTAKVRPLSKPSGSGDTSYRIRSRQFSNFWSGSDAASFASSMLAADALPTHSPKFAAILANIDAHPRQAGMVYSAFLHTYGLEWFAALLESRGWKRYVSGDAPDRETRRYAYITGDMKVEERSAVLAAFNGPDNRECAVITLLFGSPAMSEGVDTKRIRHVHIMEPPWHFAAIDQIIARAVRLHSHDDLPEADRTVQPYIYLSDYPVGAKAEREQKTVKKEDGDDEPTTDVALYYKAIRKKLITDHFFRALIEASIDCTAHIKTASAIAKKNIHCMMCAPDNKPLFKRDIVADMAGPVTCVQASSRNVVVEEIKLAGQTFYWRREPTGALLIFEYDEPTSSYIKLAPSSKWYARVFKKLSAS